MKGSRETRFPFLLYPHRLLSVLKVVLEVLGGGAVLRYAQRRGGRPSVGSLLYFYVVYGFLFALLKSYSLRIAVFSLAKLYLPKNCAAKLLMSTAL